MKYFSVIVYTNNVIDGGINSLNEKDALVGALKELRKKLRATIDREYIAKALLPNASELTVQSTASSYGFRTIGHNYPFNIL